MTVTMHGLRRDVPYGVISSTQNIVFLREFFAAGGGATGIRTQWNPSDEPAYGCVDRVELAMRAISQALDRVS